MGGAHMNCGWCCYLKQMSIFISMHLHILRIFLQAFTFVQCSWAKLCILGRFSTYFMLRWNGFWRAGLYCDWCFPNEASQGLAGLNSIYNMEEEKKVKARAAVTKFRDKKKREEEENMARRERLKKENEDILRRTAVHEQVNTSSTSNIVWGLRQKLWQWPKNCNKVLKCLQNLSELGCFGW